MIIKPRQWAVSPAEVSEEWAWFWKHCIVSYPLWEGGGDPLSVNPAPKDKVDYALDIALGSTPPVWSGGGLKCVDGALSIGGIGSYTLVNYGAEHTVFIGYNATTIASGVPFAGAAYNSGGYPLAFAGTTIYYSANGSYYNKTHGTVAGEDVNYAVTRKAANSEMFINGKSIGAGTVTAGNTLQCAAVGAYENGISGQYSGDIYYIYVLDAEAPETLVRAIALDPYGPFRMADNVVAWVGGISSTLTGTAVSSITESDIVSGGKTIILTLTGDTWVAAGATFDAQRQDIINGLDSAQAEATGWDAEVKAKESVTAVVRTSATVVTVTLTAAAAYDITAQETITATIPASALVTSASAVVASPTFTVDSAVSGFQAAWARNANIIQGAGIAA